MSEIPATTFKKLEEAIRKQCIECFGGQRGEVDGCTSPKCSLYPYRNGAKMKGKARSDGVRNLKNITA